MWKDGKIINWKYVLSRCLKKSSVAEIMYVGTIIIYELIMK